MIKTVKIDYLRYNGVKFLNEWEKEKNNIKLSMKSMYSLMKLKKGLEQEFDKINEMIKLIADKYNATINEDGSFQFSLDKVDEADHEMRELSQTEIDFEYSPIQLNDDSYLPPNILDAIFDFVEIDE